jgi:acetoin utilization deacetylase AcuC-like enzyme
VADICCQGRVVSVLEGGYGRTPLQIPAPPLLFSNAPAEQNAAKRSLDKTFFSDCAMQHLKGLVDPYFDESSKKS